MSTAPAVTLSASRLAGLVGDFDRSPAYLGLADALRELIGDGRLAYGTRLPSERDLTAVLGVSRTTVTRAYAELRDSAYAEAKVGSGTFTRLPGGPIRAHDRTLRPGNAGAGMLDMVCAAATAPPGIAAAYAQAASDLPAYLGGTGYYPAGLPELQVAIARAYTDRGLPTDADQIIVTPGALAATAVVGAALAGPRDKVLVESPTYPNATKALRTGGGRLTVAPLDPGGWDLDGIRSLVGTQRPTVAYLMPDRHNPTGLVMTAADRESLAATLQRHGCIPIIDEAHLHLDFDDEPAPLPFAALNDQTITIGSASKNIWGGLRLGWIRAPRRRIDELTHTRIGLDLGAPVLEQLVLARILEDGMEDIVAANTTRLLAQRDALVAALRDRLPDWTFTMPSGGMALWCHLPAGSSTALVAAAEAQGVALAPGPVFAPAGGLDRYLRLVYTLSPDDLREAVDRIARAWAEVTSGTTTAPRRTTPGPVLVA